MASRRTPESKPAATPVRKAKTPTKRATAAAASSSAAAKPRSTSTPKPKAKPVVVSPDMRRGMIAEGAYLRAERRGFAPGHEEEDWLAAEAEVDRLLGAAESGPAQ